MKDIDPTLLEKLETEFSVDFVKNAASPLLNKIFGKFWAVDKALTVENMPDYEKMPEGLRKIVFAALDTMLLLVSDRGVFMLNPGKEDMRAFYRVIEEGTDFVKIYAVSTTAKAPKELTLTLDETHLIMDSKSSSSQKVYFKEATASQLNDQQSNALQDKLKDSALQFMGEITKALKDAFKAD